MRELQNILIGKDITLEVSKGVISEIAQRAFTEGKGARPIRRIVQELLEDPIAHSIINKEFGKGHVLNARKAGSSIIVQQIEAVPASR